MTQKNILITGASGFIGSNLLKLFNSLGHNVVDFKHDILNSNDLFSVIESNSFDFIIHLAGISSVPQAEADLYKVFLVNQHATQMLLESILKHSPRSHLIFASSAQVYDTSKYSIPIKENFDVYPQNAYARTKHNSETLITNYSKIYGITSSIFRIFNHTHKSHHPEFFLPSIFDKCQKLKKEGQLEATLKVGNLDLIRDISPIQNMLLIFKNYIHQIHTQGVCETYNICSGSEINLKKLATEMGLQFQIDLNFEIDPSKVRLNESKYIVGNNEKIMAKINNLEKIKVTEKMLVQNFLEDLKF
jgi:nucleoside-diphosphate-sugar epimerase